MWMELRPKAPIPVGSWMSPGGFHSFEHRWALDRAFQFHQTIGKPRVAERIHSLKPADQEGLAKMPNLTLYTPMEDELSAGIVCFECTRNPSPAGGGWVEKEKNRRQRYALQDTLCRLSPAC